MKKFNSIIIILFVFAMVLFSFGCDTPAPSEGNDPVDEIPVDEGEINAPADNVKLIFAGDVMLARNVAKSVEKNGGGNYLYPFSPVASYLNSGEIVFVNLEGMISNTGTPDLSKLPLGPWFRVDPAAINGLTAAGIDIVSIANNHAFDYGRTAFEDCMTRLQSAGIKYCGGGFSGEDAYAPVIIESKGVKVAYLAYTNHGTTAYRALTEWENPNPPYNQQEARSGMCWLYIKWLERGIYAAREQQADIIVTSIHFGENYEKLPSSAQDRYAHLAIDRGADLVIGHSPHVTQPIMKYVSGYIAYSLGNFVFDQSETYNEGVTKGSIFEVNINKNTKKISNVKEIRTKIVEGTWQTTFE
ncbi:MAG: CapA family protein [Proteobacteria bacterium]|nr:CapA family protein [Pseudomonadota bacterium]